MTIPLQIIYRADDIIDFLLAGTKIVVSMNFGSGVLKNNHLIHIIY